MFKVVCGGDGRHDFTVVIWWPPSLLFASVDAQSPE